MHDQSGLKGAEPLIFISKLAKRHLLPCMKSHQKFRLIIAMVLRYLFVMRYNVENHIVPGSL